MPLHLLHDRTWLLAYLARGLLVAMRMGVNFFISEYQQDYLHFSPLLAGIALLPMTVTLFLTAMVVSNLIDRFNNHRILLTGALGMLACFVWAVASGNHNYFITILAPELF